MKSVGIALVSILVAASFIGCPLLLKKKKGAADDEDPATPSAADAATVSVTGIGAKNEADVLRYANETPLPNEPAVIGKDGAIARNFPGNGPQVALLPKGTPVAKIAQYFSTAVLVMFDDPSGDGTKLIGWVSPKAFDAAAPAPTKIVVVPPKKDAGGGTTQVVHDAGGSSAPTVHDAGGNATPSVRDAGGSSAPTVQDAGGGNSSTLPQPPRGVVAVPPVNGKCPDSWTISENMCRKKCSGDSDCGRGTKCTNKGGAKVCTSDH